MGYTLTVLHTVQYPILWISVAGAAQAQLPKVQALLQENDLVPKRWVVGPPTVP
jgi:hypothetical protein